LGIGDWAQSPIPNPQSPIPNNSFITFKKIFYLYSLNIEKINKYRKYKKMFQIIADNFGINHVSN